MTATHPENQEYLPTQVPQLEDSSLAKRRIDIAKLSEHIDVAIRSRGMSSAEAARLMGMPASVLSRMRNQPDRTQIGAVQGFEMLDLLGARAGDYLCPRVSAEEPPQAGAA